MYGRIRIPSSKAGPVTGICIRFSTRTAQKAIDWHREISSYRSSTRTRFTSCKHRDNWVHLSFYMQMNYQTPVQEARRRPRRRISTRRGAVSRHELDLYMA